ncbi:hypothetical protein [Parafilimonas sp.]|uniref:hypothetical protein n=1 Tax=Parafilimonas sp. TaxID=1969739 RepID=UPI0039E3E932
MKYILKKTGSGSAEDTNALKDALNANHADIIDDSMLPDLAMLEIDHENAQKLQKHLGDKWQLFPEKKYSVPDTRKQVRK